MQLRNMCKDMSLKDLVIFIRENNISPFKDSLCPKDVMGKYPSRRMDEGCEYCVRKYSGKR